MSNKLLTIRMRPMVEKSLRVWAAMSDQPRNEAMESALRCGLADAARERGRDFEKAYRNACYAALGQTMDSDPMPNAPMVDEAGDVGQGVRRSFLIRSATIDALNIFAKMAGEAAYRVANDVVFRRILYLASANGDGFYEAFSQATAYAFNTVENSK